MRQYREPGTGRFQHIGQIVIQAMCRAGHSPQWKNTHQFKLMQDNMDDQCRPEFQLLEVSVLGIPIRVLSRSPILSKSELSNCLYIGGNWANSGRFN